MSKTDKSKAKTKKHMKVSTKNKIIITVAIVLTVLVCFAYIAMQTGLPAKILPGAKIVKTTDGKEKTVDRVSIVEMNYYYSITYSQYVSYGLIQDASTLDEIYNTTTGQTYGEMLWENAANSAQADYLLYEAAKASGFEPVATDRYVEDQVDTVRQTCEYMNALRGTNMTADQYLQSSYGKGMTVQIFRKIMKRAAVIEEFRTYLQQTTFVPNEATISAKFDENKDDYTFVRFHLFYVNANLPEEPTEEEKTKLLAEAEEKTKKIVDESKTVEEFEANCLAISSDSYRESIESGSASMENSGYTKEALESASPELAEFLFSDETKPLDTFYYADSEGEGYYAVMFQEIYIEEELTGAYRVIELDNDTLADLTSTEEEKAAAITEVHQEAEELKAQVTTEDQFIKLAKKHSIDSSSYIGGGYYSGITESKSFTPVTNEDGTTALSSEDQQLVDWLFDSSRQRGDMIIIDCGTSVKLYYFCDAVPAWMDTLRTSMVSDNYSTWYSGVVGDTSYATIVNHGLIDFFS